MKITGVLICKKRPTGVGGPETRDGRLYAPDVTGLGVKPVYASLGDPVARYGLTA